ncbi:hypothetical protein CQA49_08090 [Helicobacter sp. MIT 00-7814]|uniref:portal protein n=1 Tax=unclassified Helicobacter TaxID=2593540 RepID=UPI000E1E2B84|nr:MULTISPECIES: hypothetical protein [unclassified Helicobacter]RDU51886.1 hypothetical protein CQA37_09240 [Helicobacter sp. MIT 99-10781]RDU52565.1 hypothetical protein CQA49_08090 [Helicobacter sp. MIT 00-7814]
MLTIAQLNDFYTADKNFAQSALNEYNDAKKYYHGNQLSEEMKAILAQRGQIPIVENIYKMIINKILGYKIQSITEINVTGRQEEDKPLANLLQDLLRAFNQCKTYEREISLRDRDLIMGMGVLELWVEKDKQKNFHITLKHIPTQSFLIDKFSTDLNALDSRRFHKVLNIDESIAQKYNIPLETFSLSEARAEVIETWAKESGKWNRYIWHTNKGIYAYEEQPFKNNCHPFIVGKYAIDENYNFYGLFRDIKPLQDYINVSENRQANMMGSMKVFFEESAIINKDEFVSGASLDNAIVQVRDNALKEKKIEFIHHQADIATLSQKTEQKRALAKVLSGLNDEALGTAINRQSGTAIAQRRDAGLMGLQEYIRGCDLMDRLMYEKVLDLMQHYYTQKQIFRIVDKKTGERYFSINTEPNNTIKIGVFDLIYKTQLKTQGREERFAHWAEMLKTISSIRPDIVTSLLPLMLKDTDSPIVEDIEEVLAEAEKQAQEQAQAQQKEIQAQRELELATAQAKIQELEAKANKNNAQSEIIKQATQEAQNAQSGESGNTQGAQNPHAQQNAQNPKQEQIKNGLNSSVYQMRTSPSDMR